MTLLVFAHFFVVCNVIEQDYALQLRGIQQTLHISEHCNKILVHIWFRYYLHLIKFACLLFDGCQANVEHVVVPL